jgi:hypothetical protein
MGRLGVYRVAFLVVGTFNIKTLMRPFRILAVFIALFINLDIP